MWGVFVSGCRLSALSLLSAPRPQRSSRTRRVQVEGRGNGIRTNIVNNVDIARALDRPPTCAPLPMLVPHAGSSSLAGMLRHSRCMCHSGVHQRQPHAHSFPYDYVALQIRSSTSDASLALRRGLTRKQAHRLSMARMTPRSCPRYSSPSSRSTCSATRAA